MAIELAAELDRALRGLGVGQALRRIALQKHALAAELVIRRRAAEIHHGDLLELVDGIDGGT